MGSSDLVTPVSSSDWDDGELGENDGSSDSGSNFLSALDSKTDVTIAVSDDDKSLESGSLTGSSLFLNGHDLHDFILDFASKEPVDDLVLFDRESEEINLL